MKGSLSKHICTKCDDIDADALLNRIAAVAPSPIKKKKAAVAAVTTSKKHALDTKIEKEIAAAIAPPPTATTANVKRQKTGYVYNWFQEWNRHAKNGNVGLIPPSAQHTTWEQFVETPEYGMLHHFEEYMNVLLE